MVLAASGAWGATRYYYENFEDQDLDSPAYYAKEDVAEYAIVSDSAPGTGGSYALGAPSAYPGPNTHLIQQIGQIP